MINKNRKNSIFLLAHTGFPTCKVDQPYCVYPDEKYTDTITGTTSCYRVFRSAMDWSHARVACQLWGGDLVSIHTANENNWIASHLLVDANEPERAWIGMNSFEAYIWTNGDYAFIQNMSSQNQGSLTYPIHAVFISAGGSLGQSSVGNWYKDHSQESYSSVCEKNYMGFTDNAAPTTSEAPLSTTCSPFGSPSSCTNLSLWDQYGIMIPYRGVCLILRGINASLDGTSTWNNANAACTSIPNGALARMEDASKWKAVSNLAAIAKANTGNAGVWVGLQRTNDYRWTDGEKLSYVPSPSTINLQTPKDCFAYSTISNDFNDTSCADVFTYLPYVCEVVACPDGMISVPDCTNANFVCVEENECFSGKADCGIKFSATCIDLPHDQGKYKCQCASGFQQADSSNPQSACVDIRECDNPTTCQQQINGGLCIEQTGSYLCACANGFRIQTTGNNQPTCVEINECVEQPGICDGGACVNSVSNYSCQCPPGYEFKNGHCPDINECALALNPCGLPSDQAFCHNMPGTTSDHPSGYLCVCPPGYMFPLTEKYCVEINNCQQNGPNIQPCGQDPNIECVNFQGSYYCACTNQRLFNRNTKQCVQPATWPITYDDSGTSSLSGYAYADPGSKLGAGLLSN